MSTQTELTEPLRKLFGYMAKQLGSAEQTRYTDSVLKRAAALHFDKNSELDLFTMSPDQAYDSVQDDFRGESKKRSENRHRRGKAAGLLGTGHCGGHVLSAA